MPNRKLNLYVAISMFLLIHALNLNGAVKTIVNVLRPTRDSIRQKASYNYGPDWILSGSYIGQFKDLENRANNFKRWESEVLKNQARARQNLNALRDLSNRGISNPELWRRWLRHQETADDLATKYRGLMGTVNELENRITDPDNPGLPLKDFDQTMNELWKIHSTMSHDADALSSEMRQQPDVNPEVEITEYL